KAEVSVQDLVLPLAADLVIAGGLTVVFWRLFWRNQLAGYVAAVLAALFVGGGYEPRLGLFYAVISVVIPVQRLGVFEGPIISSLFLAVIFLVCWQIGRGVSWIVSHFSWRARDLVRAVAIAGSITFAFQAASAIVSLAESWPQFFYK